MCYSIILKGRNKTRKRTNLWVNCCLNSINKKLTRQLIHCRVNICAYAQAKHKTVPKYLKKNNRNITALSYLHYVFVCLLCVCVKWSESWYLSACPPLHRETHSWNRAAPPQTETVVTGYADIEWPKPIWKTKQQVNTAALLYKYFTKLQQLEWVKNTSKNTIILKQLLYSKTTYFFMLLYTQPVNLLFVYFLLHFNHYIK